MSRSRHVRLCYNMLTFYDSIGFCNWVSYVRKCLFNNGYGYIWESQYVDNTSVFIANFVQRLKDQYIQSWGEMCRNTNKLYPYIHFKQTIEVSKYVYVITIDKFRKSYGQFQKFGTLSYDRKIYEPVGDGHFVEKR